MKSQPPQWQIEEALQFIRTLSADVEASGYCLCLGGGVLARGQSSHDLDLLALGRPAKRNLARLLRLFEKQGYVLQSSRPFTPSCVVYKFEKSARVVEVYVTPQSSYGGHTLRNFIWWKLAGVVRKLRRLWRELQ